MTPAEVIARFNHRDVSRAEDQTILDKCDEDLIFQNLSLLVEERSDQCVPYISSLFLGSLHHSASSYHRRGKVFLFSLELLRKGVLVEECRLSLVDCLFSNIRNLSKEQAQNCSDAILSHLPCFGQQSWSGSCSMMELLPQLISFAGVECREYTIQKFCTTTWPIKAVVMLASTLVEINSLGNSHDSLVIEKISAYLQETSNLITIPLDDLPLLIYQLTLVAASTPAHQIKSQVIETVVDSLDCLVDYFASTLPSIGTNTEHVMSTIIHHLSFLISKDQNISLELVKQIRNRQIFKCRKVSQQSTSLSPSRFLVTLLGARSPRTSGAILTGIVETIQEICQFDSLVQDTSIASYHLWFGENIWKCGAGIRSIHIMSLFARLFETPYISPELSGPLLELSLLLLDSNPNSRRHSSWANLSSPALALSSPTATFSFEELLKPKMYCCHSIGAKILVDLFEKYPHLRVQIMRELTLRLQLPSNSSHSSQSLLDRSVLIIFRLLLSRCLDGILEVVSELHEIFLSLTVFHPHTASDIVTIFASIFSLSPPLANRCILSLRKSSFSKDVLNRQTALCALTSLLRYQLEFSRETRPIAFSSSQVEQYQLPDIRPQYSSIGISIDEIITLYYRFLQQQSPVRSTLYHNLLCLFQSFADFQESISNLLRQHVLKLCVEQDSFLTNSQNSRNPLEDALFLSLDTCVDSMGNNLENFCDLFMLSIVLTRAEVTTDLELERVEKRKLMKTLWRFCFGLSAADLSHYSIPPDLTTLIDYKKLTLVIEAIQCALVCVWSLPLDQNLSDQSRIDLFLRLSQRLEDSITRAVKYRRTFKERERSETESFSGGLPSPSLPGDYLNQVGRNVIGVEATSLACIEIEVNFLAKISDLLNTEHEEESTNACLRQQLLDSPVAEFLRAHIRERSLRVVEAILEFVEELSYVLSFDSTFEISSSQLRLRLDLNRIKGEIKGLYPSILRDLMSIRTVERDGELKSQSFPSLIFPPSSNSLSTKQLALRGMLGCIRLEGFLGQLLSNSGHRESMVEMLESGTNFSSAPNDVEFYFRKFVTLFLALNEKAGRGEAHIVVLILGEISALLEDRAKVQQFEFLLGQCNDRLQSPSTLTTQSLIQVSILRLAPSHNLRYEMIIKMADLISSSNSSINFEEENEFDESLGGRKNKEKGSEETFTFVSSKTSVAATNTLLGILDKVAASISTLSKLEVRSVIVDDTEIPQTLVLELCSPLQSCLLTCVKLLELRRASTTSITVFSLLLKLYKLQVSLTKQICGGISKKYLPSAIVLSPPFREMSQRTAEEITPAIHKNLAQIHNTHNDGSKKNSRNKLSKLIPDLIFQMESLDVLLIKLLSLLKDREKIVVGRWIKRTTSRDFRLKTDLIEAEKDKARDREERESMKKRPPTTAGIESKKKRLRQQESDE